MLTWEGSTCGDNMAPAILPSNALKASLATPMATVSVLASLIENKKHTLVKIYLELLHKQMYIIIQHLKSTEKATIYLDT